jgi:Uma2 family endonuclease
MTAVAQLKVNYPTSVNGKVRKLTLDKFRQNPPRDGWKYDWDSGFITKYKRMVSEKQRYIVRNLSRAFHKTAAYAQGNDLLAETEMAYDDNRYRIPDMAYFTEAQTKAAAHGTHAVSEFVIEIISDNDNANKVEDKLWEYFEEGVKVVWQVFVSKKLVKIYTQSARRITICTDDEICSASPVLPDFALSVNQIFELK